MTSPVSLVANAAAWAAELHAHQRRKVSGAPYFAHLLGAAGIAANINSDEIAIAAAFLHDAIEDQDATFADANARLADPRAREVWDVVEACTDVLVDRKQYDWRARKQLYLDKFSRLAEHDDPRHQRRVLAVALADKLYNARAIETEIRAEGDAAFARMAGGAESLTWYMPELCDRLMALSVSLGSTDLMLIAREYEMTIARITRVFEHLPSIRSEVVANLDDRIPVGRAADLRFGLSQIEIRDPNGLVTHVRVRLTPTQLGTRSGATAEIASSVAATEERFPEAIGGAVGLAMQALQFPASGSRQRLGRAFQAASTALEHGASSAEASAAMLVGLNNRVRAIPLSHEAIVDGIGSFAGPEVNKLLKECREVPRGKDGVPLDGSRLAFMRRNKLAGRNRSVCRVLAADELPRAERWERSLRRKPSEEVAATSNHAIRELYEFARACEHRLGDSLSMELADVAARIRNRVEVIRELTREADRRPAGARRDDFELREADGTVLAAHVEVVTHPSFGSGRMWGPAEPRPGTAPERVTLMPDEFQPTSTLRFVDPPFGR